MELPNGDAGIQVIQKLLVTHWDSGFHAIAPIQAWNEETLESNPLEHSSADARTRKIG
jgi:hypothetical protein